MTDETSTIIGLIGDACTNNQIRYLLRNLKTDDPQIRVSGGSDILLNQLKSAYHRGSLSMDDLRVLLASGEENGRQHIFFYRPKQGHASDFRDPNEVASRLWGNRWRSSMGFPQFHLSPTEMEWGDFRIDFKPDLKNPEWTIKIYAGRQIEKLLDVVEKPSGNSILITKKLERKWIRLVWVIKWRPRGLLEIRVPAVQRESLSACREERDQVWEMVRKGIQRSSFNPLDLQPAMNALVSTAEDKSPQHRVATTLASHTNGGGSAQFNPAREDGSLFSNEAHKSAIGAYDTYPKLDVYWLPHDHTPFDGELRVQLGVYDPFGIRIGSKASPEAVDYVVNRLWQLRNA